ncbi:4'-phosphopantetheinyl transferase superfamily protein [Clostridium estertheticum]|uniref:4'-phosphopantetheinyl transferase family protein n=1 Tax=Clostridium estertheticum TaxID=238834 RepID=UPI001C0C4AC6|nr:4'-phosphopantetheinyl transferase superfamily protein [Clostridium estertheticum]WAG64501.1 4'-phosphopantetheinyl transferase superfamily protein [Clostridium estertheticum]
MSCFYDLWTLKESYIKAIGRGLSIPFSSFNIKKNDYSISVRNTIIKTFALSNISLIICINYLFVQVIKILMY